MEWWIWLLVWVVLVVLGLLFLAGATSKDGEEWDQDRFREMEAANRREPE